MMLTMWAWLQDGVPLVPGYSEMVSTYCRLMLYLQCTLISLQGNFYDKGYYDE